MPPNQRATIVKRFHQADARIVRAQKFLATVVATLDDRHAFDRANILALITDLEQVRARILDIALPKYTKTPRDLHKPGDLATIVSLAQPIPQIHYESQTAAYRRARTNRK